MLETMAIISNGIVIVAIGALYRKVNSQEKTLTDHRLAFTEAIANRPGFDQVDERIEKAELRQCAKLKPVKDCCDEVKEKLFSHLLETGR